MAQADESTEAQDPVWLAIQAGHKQGPDAVIRLLRLNTRRSGVGNGNQMANIKHVLLSSAEMKAELGMLDARRLGLTARRLVPKFNVQASSLRVTGDALSGICRCCCARWATPLARCRSNPPPKASGGNYFKSVAIWPVRQGNSFISSTPVCSELIAATSVGSFRLHKGRPRRSALPAYPHTPWWPCGPAACSTSFCLRLQPWTAQELSAYVEARLQDVGIHANPFDAAALQLLLQAGNGLPRLLNHLAQRALEEAAAQNSRVVSAAHVQRVNSWKGSNHNFSLIDSFPFRFSGQI